MYLQIYRQMRILFCFDITFRLLESIPSSSMYDFWSIISGKIKFLARFPGFVDFIFDAVHVNSL